ncbi:zinc-ribbon domain-containing protein [Candidatus Pacearchaeota archaeon]|nr:zinc-ribbon domain-containing protein [Candidatus Pacearchaeota archaeon]
MQYCHHCGRKIKEQTRFCPYCGKRLGFPDNIKSNNSEKEPYKNYKKHDFLPPNKKEKKMGLIIIALVVMLGVFAYAYYKDSSDAKNLLTLSNNSNSTLNEGNCPYDCCGGEDYDKKECYSEEKCIENLCIDIEPNLSVSKVIDGDTIVLSDNNKVRLLGINTEEKGQRCFELAKTRVEELVKKKEIKLEGDLDDKDIYGRLLRYIIVDGKNLNILLVEEGLASVFIVGENNRYTPELLKAEEIAKQNQGCIWEKSQSCSGCIGISYFHLNAEGNDCQNTNDEYITFKNTCDIDCDITSWTVKDEATHTYTFPTYILKGQGSLTLYSGDGIDKNNEFYWENHGNSGSCKAIWNNDGDIVFLRDNEGKLVLDYRGF